MELFTQWLQTNYQYILTVIFIADQILSAVKTINSRNLTLRFDQLRKDSDLKTVAVNVLSAEVSSLKAQLLQREGMDNKVIDKISEVEKYIERFKQEPILVDLQKSLQTVNSLEQSLKLKDEIIQRYAADLRDIKIALQKK